MGNRGRVARVIQMIDFDLARRKVLQNTPVLDAISVPLDRCGGYVLAESVATKEPVPLFDSSAVDGYAVRSRDITDARSSNPVALDLIGTIRAGDIGSITVKKNTAVKIFTGAPVPHSANAVVMVEVTEKSNGKVLIKSPVIERQNIRRKGEEFKKGQQIFSPGIAITPPVVAMLASLGKTNIKVYKKPHVTLVITGDELRPPSAKLKPGQIRDSNSYALKSFLESIGIERIDIIHSKDSKSDTRRAFTKALQRSDVVISVGGVSVGEYDLVKDVLEDIGVRQVFWKVAMKPGKPNYFGMRDKKLVFGLPGNPVSAMVSFYVLVRPALAKMMGSTEYTSFIVQARLTESLTKKPGRMEFVRGMLGKNETGELTVTAAKGQDSHMIGGMAAANCLIYFPKEYAVLEQSSIVDVELLVYSL
jgi:molybdopterin molybdotransferase